MQAQGGIMNIKENIYRRFERYVKVNTQSNDKSDTCPSTSGQLKLGKLLVSEMKQMGLKKVMADKNGYITAELPSNVRDKRPVIGFLAHLDTSDGASGKNVKPKLHKNYRGGNIAIDKKTVLSSKDTPELLSCAGEDIITASGKTLLGADDKSGIAIILSAVEFLLANPHIKHGTVKIGFTPDEEIGRGADRFNVKKFGADYAYTVDGEEAGTINTETFNADSLEINIKGRNYHPGQAKNVMISAVRIAADIINSWPENMMPETTEKREGFVMFMTCNSEVDAAKIKGLVREHDLARLERMENLLKSVVEEKKLKYPGAEIELILKKQYRNMGEILKKHPEAVEKLLAAVKANGMEPEQVPVRGGTDGARLSFMGLPTPNIFSGGGNYHGHYEWVSLDGMEKAAKTVISLVQEWAK